MARTKNMEGKSDAKLKIVERPKVDDVPPSEEKSITVKGVTSRKEIELDDALYDATLKKDGGWAISKKHKKSSGDGKGNTNSKVEVGSNVVVDKTSPSKKQSRSHSGSNVDLKKVSGQPSSNKRSKSKQGKASKAIKKPRKSEATNETPFRSSLGGMITLV